MTSQKAIESSNLRQATIISASRRYAHIIDDEYNILKGIIASKAMDITVGDRVACLIQDDQAFIQSVLPRKNCFSRVYRKQTKLITANLDKLFIVTAVTPLFNTAFIDRVSVAAELQNIPYSLVFNKIDLDIQPIQPLLEVYADIGFEIVRTSAKFGQGLDAFKACLADPNLKIVALCGISGVGKSTLLNRLVPEASRKTAEVSERTGQGKQTTTQSFAYPYEREKAPPLLIVDLPGLQNFGFSETSHDKIREAFPEILSLKAMCEFSDCSHIAEQNCAVIEAVHQGTFRDFRYQSYRDIIKEIEDSKEY